MLFIDVGVATRHERLAPAPTRGLNPFRTLVYQARGLAFDVTPGATSGTSTEKGHFTTTRAGRVLKDAPSPCFMVELAQPDIGIASGVANHLRIPMPLGAAVRAVYNWARAAGRGRQDWMAILEHVRARAALPTGKLQPGSSSGQG